MTLPVAGKPFSPNDPADALPERYRGVLFGVAPLLNHVVMSAVEPDGSSVRTQIGRAHV